jgi:hypothetical protein
VLSSDSEAAIPFRANSRPRGRRGCRKSG